VQTCKLLPLLAWLLLLLLSLLRTRLIITMDRKAHRGSERASGRVLCMRLAGPVRAEICSFVCLFLSFRSIRSRPFALAPLFVVVPAPIQSRSRDWPLAVGAPPAAFRQRRRPFGLPIRIQFDLSSAPSPSSRSLDCCRCCRCCRPLSCLLSVSGARVISAKRRGEKQNTTTGTRRYTALGSLASRPGPPDRAGGAREGPAEGVSHLNLHTLANANC
jgi:hypothetical protein